MTLSFISILLFIVGIIAGAIAMFVINNIKNSKKDAKAEKILKTAYKEAEKIKNDALVSGREEAKQYKIDVENDLKERKIEVKESEKRLQNREENIDRRDKNLQNREDMLDAKEKQLQKKQNEIQDEQVKVEELKKEQLDKLEEISGYSKEKAKSLVLKRVEEDMNLEISSYIKERELEAKLTADKKAKSMLVESMQKYASDVANEQTITVVNLPNDDMKGRIIGREGRNIRTIEAVTGVDLIIDDTPEVIVLSSFDPLRREIARVTLETLIKDGRIHPARIEEVYDKTAKDMKVKIMEYGENALFKLGIAKMDPELIELVGRLNFRTSFGQNALTHSIEVASLAGVMAQEIGENVNLAKRAGLLHDIGKSVDHEIEGSHVEIGASLAKKYKENDTVINAIESHHGDTDATSTISALVAIADALSASRPGARSDSLENYIQRMQELEGVANKISGVDKAYAMQAGRELRVVVKPEKISDAKAHKVARDIKINIENELQYPGTIKITVIRETRAQEEAK